MEAAKKAAELALRYQPNIAAETKPDRSPVTQADRECERMIARMLTDAFPDDGVFGEEGARAETRSGRRCFGGRWLGVSGDKLKQSASGDTGVAYLEGEIPADAVASFAITATNLPPRPSVGLRCSTDGDGKAEVCARHRGNCRTWHP